MHSDKFFVFFAILLLISILSPLARGGEAGENQIDKKYAISLSGSWNSLKNGKLNGEYIETWRSWGYLDDKINSGYGLTSEVIYFITPKISIGVGLVYIGGSTEKDQAVIDYVNNDTTVVQGHVKTRLYAPSLSLRYHIRREEIDFSLGISESLLFGRLSRYHSWNPFLRVGPIKDDFRSAGIGFQIFGCIHYRLNDIILYTMNVGYSKLETGDLVKDESETALRGASPINVEPINLDYSGPFISAGLMFRLF